MSRPEAALALDDSQRTASGVHEKPGIRSLAAYGLMAFPLAFVGLPIYLHAPDFYAVNFGQSLTTLGAVLLALRLFDAVQDPVIGSLSDRFHTRRKEVLALGALLLGAGFWMLFNPHMQSPLTWFAVKPLFQRLLFY